MTTLFNGFDSGLVSDAMDSLGLDGLAQGLRRMTTALAVSGRVRTVLLEEARGRASTLHLGTETIASAAPGEVIVVQHHDRADCSGWGGILSAAAVYRNLGGAIVDGMCRDVDESEAAGFPVFARGACPRTARGRVIQTGMDCPVQIGGVAVHPGDYVVADGTGIVFIPAARAEEVAARTREFADKERKMLEAIRSGTPVTRVMGVDYENLVRRV